MCRGVMAKKDRVPKRSRPGARELPYPWNLEWLPLVYLFTVGDVRRENFDHEEQQCKKCRWTPYVFTCDATMPTLTDENMAPFSTCK
jgi:hypothetical protein